MPYPTHNRRGIQPSIPEQFHAEILDLRNAGKTIVEICNHFGWVGENYKGQVQNICIRFRGRRDYRETEAGYQPGKAFSSKRRLAP